MDNINTETNNSLLNKCRTCMQEFSNKRRKSDKNQNICEVPNGSKYDTTVMEMLLLIQPQIQIQMEDNLPKLICSYCVEKLIIVYEFIELYRKTDKQFRDILKDNENIVICKKDIVSKKITAENIDEKETTETTELYNLQIEELINEDYPKDDESDWPEFDDDSENELSEDAVGDNESLFENPFSDDEDDEWMPESSKTSKKNNKYESTKHTTSTEISMKNISKKQMKTISTEISPTNITKVQLETTISAKNITKKQTEEVTSENSTINLTKPQLEINKEAEIPKDNDRGNVECRKCGKVFDNITLWQDHTCDHRLENEARLKQKEFKKRKNKQKCFECEYCHKEFPKPSSYKMHLLVHTGEANHLCTECGKKFKTAGILRVHMLRHKGEKTFHCKQCPKKFVCSSGLYSHMLLHTNNKPYVCDVCGSAFRMPHQLKKHSLCHSERKYQCEYCDKKFSDTGKRAIHTRTHTGEKPYRCKYCDRAFAQSGDCIKHLRLHVGDKIYMCELCPQAFALRKQMREHFATHINDDEETRIRNLEARSEEQRRLEQITVSVKET